MVSEDFVRAKKNPQSDRVDIIIPQKLGLFDNKLNESSVSESAIDKPAPSPPPPQPLAPTVAPPRLPTPTGSVTPQTFSIPRPTILCQAPPLIARQPLNVDVSVAHFWVLLIFSKSPSH
jgi:hypothetical protein